VSDETYNAIEKAIQAHLAEEKNGALLNHWLLVAHGISATESDLSHYLYLNHDGPPHEWMGLLDMAMSRFSRVSNEED
jgi:hypothetical protein